MDGVGCPSQGRYRRDAGVGPRVCPAAPAVGWEEQSRLLMKFLYASGKDVDPGPERGHSYSCDIQPPLNICLPVGPLHLGEWLSGKGGVEQLAPFAREDIGPAFGVSLDVAGAREVYDLRLGESGL